MTQPREGEKDSGGMIDHDTEKRLTSVEVELSSVKDVLFSFKKDFDDKFDSLFESIGHMRDRHIESARPQWAAYFGVMMIVLAIVGMIGSGYVRDQQRVEATQEKMISLFAEHVQKVGHPGMEREIQRINALTDSQTSEIRLLQRTLDQHIELTASINAAQEAKINRAATDVEHLMYK